MASNNKRIGTRLQDEDYIKASLEIDELDWEMDENTPEFEVKSEATQNKQRRTDQRLVLADCTEACTSRNINPHRVLFGEYSSKQEIASINLLENLFDEIILRIFSYLSTQSLIKCVQVCHRWKRIGCDASLWKEINLDSKHITTAGVLGAILHRGVKRLTLNKAEVLAPICITDCETSPQKSCGNFSLTHLDASITKFGDDNLACLLFRCNSLKCLSLEGCRMGLREITAISYNHNLQVLNLALAVGLTPSAIDVVTRKCLKLSSLNLSWTNQTRDCLSYICRCKDLTELNLSGLRGGINRKVLEKLVMSCKHLTELDFSDVTLQIGGMKLIADNSTRLKKLSISRCSDVRAEQLMDLTELKSLSYLNLFGFVNSEALDRFTKCRPDIFINKDTFSPIARPIVTTTYTGHIWEQYSGFII